MPSRSARVGRKKRSSKSSRSRHPRHVVVRWSEAKRREEKLWLADRSSGLRCSTPYWGADPGRLFCGRPACPGVPPAIRNVLRRAPTLSRRFDAEHAALHRRMADSGPAPLCARHAKLRPKSRRPTPCDAHLKAIEDLIDGLRIVGCSKDRKVWRKLDRLAREAGIVELAATAGARSDLQRSRLPKKPREGKPPRGWSLARKILDAKGLPADYVPDRRNDLVREKGTDPHRAAPMPRSLLVQSQIRFAELEARKEQFREIAPAVRAYRDALLTKADPNEIDRLARALNAAKEKAGPLPEIPRPPSPRPATSPFWTAAVHDLHKLFEPFAAAWREKYIPRWGRGEEDAQSRKYATPGRLVRLILTALDPLEFLSATREDVRDRLR